MSDCSPGGMNAHVYFTVRSECGSDTHQLFKMMVTKYESDEKNKEAEAEMKR
jgi:hypothetical protein